ncbi:MAG: hypothetical protein PHE55_18410 [Methylococcaceae bacterium]|nr:hypothetical protein [Methylococcaceae bacterium]
MTLGSPLNWVRGIIVALALVVLIIGAILYILSAGDSKQAEKGKDAMKAAMIGLAIGVAAPTFLKELAGILEWKGEVKALSGAPALSQILLNTLRFLLGITGVIAIIMFVVGALAYLTEAGNENQLDTAKDMVKYAAIGVTVAFAALVIVTQIATLITG